MINYRIFLFSVVVLCLFQEGNECKGQKSILDNITDRFQRYCSSYPWEEIYVHTDRTEYVAGEDIWIEAYLVDRLSSRISGDSRIVYIEVLNSSNRPIVQKKIRLENGSGPGQISLPDTIGSGYYTLRAYTNWMKNFLPENCFTKKLKVYNVLSSKSLQMETEIIYPSVKGNFITEPGLSVNIDNTKPDIVELSIGADNIYRIRNGNICYLFIHTHGIINYRRALSIPDARNVADIPREQLMPGINHISVFNAAGQPVAELFILTRQKGKKEINISISDNYSLREKVSLEINNGKGSDVNSQYSNLSISVSEAGRNEFSDFSDYMILGSEFGIVPDYINNKGINNLSSAELESFLSGIKSRWIDWTKILNDKPISLKYSKETESHFIYGRLLNRNTRIPDPGKFVFLSMPGKNASFQYSLTDENGDFSFKIPIDDKFRELIIQPEDGKVNNNIKMESPFSDRYQVKDKTTDTLINTEPVEFPRMGINYQVMKIYSSDEIPPMPAQLSFTGGSKRFYGKPDIQLIMDEYIKLPVMPEVFFELMPGVFMKKRKNEYEISILDPVENRIYDKPPILLVDGVVVNDVNIIANIDPEKVEKIDAIKSKYFVGNYLFYGIVNVITRTGDLSIITLPDYAVRLPYRVAEPVKAFVSPGYRSDDIKLRRIPDLRNTLYWNPSVIPASDGKAELEFWTSDFKSDFEVNIQGIDADGRAISIKKIISVK